MGLKWISRDLGVNEEFGRVERGYQGILGISRVRRIETDISALVQ